MRELIVAIDGPSGAGKSTLSRRLAKELGYVNINTGALYRTVALAATRKMVDLTDEAALGRLAREIIIEFVRPETGERVIFDGEDVSEAIRTPEISCLTSRISAYPEVRRALNELQRKLGSQGGVVLEGRDIGTVVFPQAEVKFFLSASAEERGRRRNDELKARGILVELEKTIAAVEARDAADSAREHAPLTQAADAMVIDSTAMSIEEVLQKMVTVVQQRRRLAGLAEPVMELGR
ncbi:MAG: cytidylate kinase [Desulfuromonadaceae bacterium GWC2_58_13]|nr:MAG: cytidylate kinase [Desulfuromonadaceae bacterium GWC2_58_13]